MTILHVISSLERRHGGPIAALAGLVRAQCRAGHAVAVAAPPAAPEADTIEPELKAAGGSVTNVPVLRPFRGYAAAKAALSGGISAADIVHIHGVWEEILYQAAVLAREHDIPYLIRTCGMLDRWSLSQKPLKKRVYLALRLKRVLRCAAAVHTTAESERGHVSRIGGVRTVVVPNGLDLSVFRNLTADNYYACNHPSIKDKTIVLFLGRLHPKKGVQLLIPAFRKCRAANAVLVIAGPDHDGYRHELEELAASSDDESPILFCGPIYGDDRFRAMRDADLFVLPSFQENFGIAVAEAMAAGTPVIVSDQVALESEVRGSGGGAVTSCDVDSIARALSTWLGDAALREEAGIRAGNFAQETFSWDRLAERLDEIYSQKCDSWERSEPGR